MTADGDDDGGIMTADLVGHADGGDDGVEGEDDVEEQRSGRGRWRRRRRCAWRCRARPRLRAFVDFVGALGEEKEAADEEDQVAAGDLAGSEDARRGAG